jgi:hypothetical protein
MLGILTLGAGPDYLILDGSILSMLRMHLGKRGTCLGRL